MLRVHSRRARENTECYPIPQVCPLVAVSHADGYLWNWRKRLTGSAFSIIIYENVDYEFDQCVRYYSLKAARITWVARARDTQYLRCAF